MDNLKPNQTQEQPVGGAAPQVQPQGVPQLDSMETLKQKKGWKSNDDVVKFAEETEKSFSREQNRVNKIKQQLESAGYTLNDDGSIVPAGQQPIQGNPNGMPSQQGISGQQQPDPIYDPYTGQLITDPIALQLVRMPVGQREAFVVSAILDQREKQQTASYQAEAEILSKPEAKGFEGDVKSIMQQLPLAQRADKKQWEDALLRVKGMKYDQAIKNAGGQAIEQFINKDGLQTPQGTGGGANSVALTQDQERVYAYYQQNHPGMFKDKAHFIRATQPGMGR